MARSGGASRWCSSGCTAIAMLGTAYEVQWLEMAWRYQRYGAFYEG